MNRASSVFAMELVLRNMVFCRRMGFISDRGKNMFNNKIFDLIKRALK